MIRGPQYAISMNYSQLIHVAESIGHRIDHLEKRLAKNPRTPNASALVSELEALRDIRWQTTEARNEHADKLRASIRGLAKQ